MRRIALACTLAACGHSTATPPPAPAPEAATPGCTAETFPETVPVPEASGAIVTTLDGRAAVLLVADSGNTGDYLAIDPTSGASIESGKLPLGDGASDDLEGFTQDGDDFLGLTSSGWMRRWRRDGRGFALADGPYPIGDVDVKLRSNPPMGGLMEKHTDHFACAGPSVNCGKNYEALCMIPAAKRDPGGCAGWVGAKADGVLYCLVADGARWKVDPSRSIEVAAPGALSDCAYDADDDSLWALTNGFGGTVYRIAGWRAPGATPEEVPIPPWGFPEALAIGAGGEIYRFTDNGGTPSPAQRWRCLLRSPGAVPELRR